MSTSSPGTGLLAQHAKLIHESAISDDVAKARGYRSATTKAELERLGFGRSQRTVPSLLIPVWGVSGQIALYQSRPDEPRRNREGKIVKYETPSGAKVAIDVHPLIRPKVTDPSVPLFITEGIRKADSAISRGLCCVALLGVWNWRGSNEAGGLTALADWDSIALNDRRVHIVFDSDVAVKRQVEMAMHRLKKFLEKRGATVRILYLASGTDGSKVGLDDYFAAGGTVQSLVATARESSRSDNRYTSATDETLPYVIDHGHFCFEKDTRDGPVLVPLCNFTAAVREELVLDDGQHQDRAYIIDGVLESGIELSPARVPVDRFSAMRIGSAPSGGSVRSSTQVLPLATASEKPFKGTRQRQRPVLCTRTPGGARWTGCGITSRLAELLETRKRKSVCRTNCVPTGYPRRLTIPHARCAAASIY